tara:strand:+ start:42 stop:755 length:714 start_codon:yes stop_codon:yes gene_type:complete
MKNPELSIIIITLNEEESLPKLLKSIDKQDYKNYEIILSDAGSKDKTLEIARKNKTKIIKGGLPPYGRNQGARIAKGEILLFLDADVILPSGFLSTILSQMKKEKIDIGTVSLTPLTNNKIEKFLYKTYNLWQKLMEKINPHSVGNCILIKKGLFNKIKGFDESIKLAEDHALSRKAFHNGGKYKVFDAEILVSVRRLKQEGRILISTKYVLAVIYRLFFGEIRTDIFKYDFLGNKK